MGAESSDRCECQLSSSKLLGTEAENKDLDFRGDILHYQPLSSSSSYIRGQDTVEMALIQVGCDSSTGSEGRRKWRKTNRDPMTFNLFLKDQTTTFLYFSYAKKKTKINGVFELRATDGMGEN